MQQQERRAFPLACNFNLNTLQSVYFYLVRHDDVSAALLFKSIVFLSFRTTALLQRRAVALMKCRWKQR
jgi:hypothetical protein